MKLRSIKIAEKFIPEWNGNKELPIDEQIVIHFGRVPGTSEKGNYIGYAFDSKGQMSISYNDQIMIASFVEKVDNLEIEISGEIQKIKNGIDLSKASYPGLPELFNEIREHLFPTDDELDEKE